MWYDKNKRGIFADEGLWSVLLLKYGYVHTYLHIALYIIYLYTYVFQQDVTKYFGVS